MITYDPKNIRQMERLREEYDWSRDELKFARRMYKDTLRRYAGDRYSENSGMRETFLLMTRMAFGILRRHLVADNLRTLVSTSVPDLMPVAENLRLGLDDTLDRMRLAAKVREFVTGALAKMGVMWVGLDYWNYDGGTTARPVAQYVDFSQWCHDMWARDIEEICFCGHRKRMSFEAALNNPLFDHDAVARLRDDTLDRWMGDNDSIDDLSGRRGFHGGGAQHFFEFDSIYLPNQGVVIGLPVEGSAVPIHEPVPWTGVDTGPYHILAYDKIPNNILPSPPSDTMAYLDDLANSLMRKIAEDARNAKTVALYRPGDQADAERIQKAGNLDMLATASPDAINQLSFNGVNSQTLGAFLQTRQLFSWANGGLDTLGGLGAGADTVGQEQILLQSAGGLVDEMKGATIAAVKEIIEHIAHYLWKDEMWRPQIPRHIPGVGTIGGRFEVEDRMGDLSDYRINVSPYSGAPVTPQSKFQSLNTLLLNIVPGLMQIAQTGAIDFERAVKHYARLLDIDEVEDIFNILDTTSMPGPENKPLRLDGGGEQEDGAYGPNRMGRENEEQQIMELMKDTA